MRKSKRKYLPDWDQLAALGVPLLITDESPIRAGGADVLVQCLTELDSALPNISATSREAAALLAFFWAMRDHFPSVWDTLPPTLKSWSENGLSSTDVSPKLRRLAIAKMSRYL